MVRTLAEDPSHPLDAREQRVRIVLGQPIDAQRGAVVVGERLQLDRRAELDVVVFCSRGIIIQYSFIGLEI